MDVSSCVEPISCIHCVFLGTVFCVPSSTWIYLKLLALCANLFSLYCPLRENIVEKVKSNKRPSRFTARPIKSSSPLFYDNKMCRPHFYILTTFHPLLWKNIFAPFLSLKNISRSKKKNINIRLLQLGYNWESGTP